MALGGCHHQVPPKRVESRAISSDTLRLGENKVLHSCGEPEQPMPEFTPVGKLFGTVTTTAKKNAE